MEKRKRLKVHYDRRKKEHFQPCWTCKNACGGCSWSIEFKPVDGWQAVKTYIAANRGFEESYQIIVCPEYKREV